MIRKYLHRIVDSHSYSKVVVTISHRSNSSHITRKFPTKFSYLVGIQDAEHGDELGVHLVVADLREGQDRAVQVHSGDAHFSAGLPASLDDGHDHTLLDAGNRRGSVRRGSHVLELPDVRRTRGSSGRLLPGRLGSVFPGSKKDATSRKIIYLMGMGYGHEDSKFSSSVKARTFSSSIYLESPIQITPMLTPKSQRLIEKIMLSSHSKGL